MSGYWNDISQKEVREVLANDRDCLHSRAQADADLLNQGRFAKEVATTVTGQQSPSSQYPMQPENSPWASNPVPPGDALDKLGFDINEQEPVGSHAEIERSLPLADADPETVADRVGQEAAARSVLVHDTAAVASTNVADAPTTPLILRGGDVGQGEDRSHHSPSIFPHKSFRRRF
jgi:hypothetical protein